MALVETTQAGAKRVPGLVGDLEHAESMLGRGRLLPLLDFETSDLLRLAETLRVYARNRDLVELAERIERLEKRSPRRRRGV